MRRNIGHHLRGEELARDVALSPPRLRDQTSIALAGGGLLLILASGMNGLFWLDVTSSWRLIFRAFTFFIGLALAYAHVMVWTRRHADTIIRPDTPPPASFRVFGRLARGLWGIITVPVKVLTWRRLSRAYWGTPRPRPAEAPYGWRPQEARRLLEAEANEFAPLLPDALIGLSENLAKPGAKRRALHEKKTLIGSTMDVEVTLDLLPEATIQLGNGKRVVVLSRPLKETHWAKLTASSDGRRLIVLSRTKSLALLYAASLWPVVAPLRAMEPDGREAVLDRLAEIFVEHEPLRASVDRRLVIPSTDDSASERTRRTRRRTEAVGELAMIMKLTKEAEFAFEELVRFATDRRVIFALAPDDSDLTSVTFTFTTSVRQGELPPHIDWWRQRKDAARLALRLPSKFVAFNMDRSLAVDQYVLDVEIPSGLYVDEVYLLSNEGLQRRLPRDAVRPGYLSWSELNGRGDIRAVTWRLNSRAEKLTSPRILIRMVETPPGSVFAALLVASAVLLSVWLTGVATGTLLPVGKAEFNSAAFGVVALAISLPGLLSTWWGIAFSRTAGSFRSLTGLLSLSVSVLLSLTALGLYVARFAAGREMTWTMPGTHTIYLIRDWQSFTLFSLALINVGFILGLFVSRLWRYRALKTDARMA